MSIAEPQSRWPSDRWRAALGTLALVGLALFVYGPALRGAFVSDDLLLIAENPIIRASDGLYRFWLTTEAPDYFPLTSTIWWLEWRAWGSDPLGYHLTSLAFHVGSAAVLWRVLQRLGMAAAAWPAAAVFLVHPVNVESAAWVAELKNTLSMFLGLCAGWCFVAFDDARSRRAYAASIALFVAALLAKTAVAPLPAALLGVAWLRRGRIDRRDVSAAAPHFAAAAALAGATLFFQSHRAIGGDVVRDDGPASRTAVAGRAVWFYAGKAAVPRDLCFLYPRWPTGDVSPAAFVPLAGLVVAIVCLWPARRRVGRGIVFGCFYYLVMLAPILGLVDVYWMKFSLVCDHWQYPAIPGLIAAAALAAARALRLAVREPRARAAAGAVLVAAVVGTFAVLARGRAQIYASPVALWSDTVARDPGSPWAHNNLGVALFQARRPDLAEREFRAAIALDPDHAEARLSLGRLCARRGRVDEAIGWFQSAADRLPDSLDPRVRARRAEPQYAMAVAYQQKGDAARAEQHYRLAIGFDPGNEPAHTNLALLLSDRGDLGAAEAEFRAALALRPDAPVPHVGLGLLLMRRGDRPAAAAQFEDAIRLDPTSAVARQGLFSAKDR